MMSGVAQVIGMKPTCSFVFSAFPVAAESRAGASAASATAAAADATK